MAWRSSRPFLIIGLWARTHYHMLLRAAGDVLLILTTQRRRTTTTSTAKHDAWPSGPHSKDAAAPAVEWGWGVCRRCPIVM